MRSGAHAGLPGRGRIPEGFSKHPLPPANAMEGTLFKLASCVAKKASFRKRRQASIKPGGRNPGHKSQISIHLPLLDFDLRSSQSQYLQCRPDDQQTNGQRPSGNSKYKLGNFRLSICHELFVPLLSAITKSSDFHRYCLAVVLRPHSQLRLGTKNQTQIVFLLEGTR